MACTDPSESRHSAMRLPSRVTPTGAVPNIQDGAAGYHRLRRPSPSRASISSSRFTSAIVALLLDRKQARGGARELFLEGGRSPRRTVVVARTAGIELHHDAIQLPDALRKNSHQRIGQLRLERVGRMCGCLADNVLYRRRILEVETTAFAL